MTKPAHDYDILGGEAEDVIDALPIPSGNFEIEDTVLGAVDILHTGPDMLHVLNEQPLVADYGTGQPAFGTEERDTGDDDILGDDLGTHEPDVGDRPLSEEYGIEIPQPNEPDDEVLEKRMLLNFGGDIPDATAEEQWDFGDEIPASSTEVYGLDDVEGDDILGSAVNTQDPGFQERLAKEAAAAAPLLIKDPFKSPAAREWDIATGPVQAPAGRIVTVTMTPQVLFRGEKVMATDDVDPAGTGTRIMQVAVGNKVQKAGGSNGTLTSMFSEVALANGIRFDTAHAWSNIKVTVSFVQACTFNLSIFGKAVLDSE